MEKIEVLIAQENTREKQAKKRVALLTVIPVLAGFGFLLYSSLQVIGAKKKVAEAQWEYNGLQRAVDSVRRLRDSFRIEYLEARGFNYSTKKGLLNESIEANELLTQLLKQGNIDKGIKVKYYKKTLDQQKVWISMKELGYDVEEEQTTNTVLIGRETNSIAFGSNVPIFDLKVIALTLIRAGLKVQHLYPAQKNTEGGLIQIIRTAPADGSPDKTPPITVEQIREATNKAQLIRP